jgi:hypothetical protein
MLSFYRKCRCYNEERKQISLWRFCGNCGVTVESMAPTVTLFPSWLPLEYPFKIIPRLSATEADDCHYIFNSCSVEMHTGIM